MTIEDSLQNFGEAPIELKVEYKRVNTFLSDFCKNISRNYTFIKTKNPLPQGTRFLFRIGVPELDEPLGLKGYVKRVVTAQDAGRDESPGMDIEFIYDDDDARNAMMDRVHGLIESQMGQLLGERIRQFIESRS